VLSGVGVPDKDGSYSHEIVWYENRGVPGDANRDGRFDSSDLGQVFQAGEYEDNTAGNSTAREGDFDGDGNFTTADLIFAFQQGNYVL
jgi:hypothetical protein